MICERLTRTVLIHQSLLIRRLQAVRLPGLIDAVFLAPTLLAPLDYRFFAAAAQAWRSGASYLYDAHAAQFFNAPWSLFLLVPLSVFPDRIGQALSNLISLGGLCWSNPEMEWHCHVCALIVAK